VYIKTIIYICIMKTNNLFFTQHQQPQFPTLRQLGY
jgi:hypothetical protein